MMDERRDLRTTDLDALTREWWEAPVFDATGQPGWDEEIKAIMDCATASSASFCATIRRAMRLREGIYGGCRLTCWDMMRPG